MEAAVNLFVWNYSHAKFEQKVNRVGFMACKTLWREYRQQRQPKYCSNPGH